MWCMGCPTVRPIRRGSRAIRQSSVKAAEGLGVTHLREGYPIAQQARDWGNVGAQYPAVLLTAGDANVAVVPELGRIVAFGRTNVLRVADPGELGYPHAGGIYVVLSDGDLTVPVEWHSESATAESVTLNGSAGAGRALVMQIGVAGDTLRMRVTVSNTASVAATVAIFCRAEFVPGHVREAALRYMDQAGRERMWRNGSGILSEGGLPKEEWVLASDDGAVRVRNRFRAGEVVRCSFNWSPRGATGLEHDDGEPARRACARRAVVDVERV